MSGSGANSSSAGQVCEKCKYLGVTCLCHVEFTDTLSKQEYYWRAGQGKLAQVPGTIILGVLTKKSPDDKPQKTFDLEYKIKNSCCKGLAGTFDKCTKLYYFERDIKDFIIGGIKRESSQDSILKLKFNEDYLDLSKKMIPFYLMTKKDDKGDVVYESKNLDVPVVSEKYGEFNGETKGYKFNVTYKVTNLSALKLPLNITQTLNFFHRAINFVWCGEFHYMPITPYHVAVQECKNVPMTILDYEAALAPIMQISTNSNFDQARAEVYVMPNYKVEYGIKITTKKFGVADVQQKGLEILDKELNARADQAEASGQIFTSEEERSNWKIDGSEKEITAAGIKGFIKELKSYQFTVSGIEYFNDKKVTEVNVEMTEIWKATTALYKESASILSLFGETLEGAIDFLEKFYAENTSISTDVDYVGNVGWDATGVYIPEKYRITTVTTLPQENVLTWEGQLPSIEIKGMSHLLRSDDKNGYRIANEGEVSFKPLIGLHLNINFAIMLIKGVTTVRTAYMMAKGVCTFVNSVSKAINVNVSASKLTPEEIARSKNAKIDVTLVIYCNFKLDVESSAIAKINDARLMIPPLIDLSALRADVDLEIEAGASFKMRIWVFEGAFEVGVNVKTGMSIGYENYVHEPKGSDSYTEGLLYILFKGAELAWKAKGAVGFTNEGEREDKENKKGGWGGSEESKPEVPYYDEQSARERLVNQKEWEKGWNKTYKKELKKQGGMQQIWDKDSSAIVERKKRENAERKQAALDAANDAYPNYSPTELAALKGAGWPWSKGQVDIYAKHKTDLDEIASLNQRIKNTSSEADRLKLLRERLAYQAKVDEEVNDYNLLFNSGDYHPDDNLVTENEWRDELKKGLQDTYDRSDAKGKKVIQKELDQLKELEKSVGRWQVFDSKIWLPKGNLSKSERDKLEQKLLKK